MAQNKTTPLFLEDLQKKYKKVFYENKDFFNLYLEGIQLFRDILINVHNIMGKANKERKYAKGIYAIIALEQMQNLDFFNTHYFLLKNGFCIPAYMPLRTIFESIQRTYLCLVDKIDSQLIYNYSLIKDTQNPTPPQKLIINKYKKNHFYSPSKVRKKLYKGNKLERLNKGYEGLSKHNHPSLVSSFPSYGYAPWAIKDVSKFGVGLLASNIWLLFECFGKKFSNELYREVLNYFNKNNSSFDLVPNKSEYKNKIVLDTFGKFLEYLKNPSLKLELNEVILY